MKTIIVRTQFEALHQWIQAPEDVGFLRYKHRHLFKVEVEIEVKHGERQLEFFAVRNALDALIEDMMPTTGLSSGVAITASCEDMAELIARNLSKALELDSKQLHYVEVSEDGENAGRYYAR